MSTESESISILYVDDKLDTTDTVVGFLERETDSITIETATSVRNGLEKLSENAIDCIVSSYEISERTGLEFLEIVRKSDPNLPFILYSEYNPREVATEAIAAGATDYLWKDRGNGQYELLANRIRKAADRYRSARRATELDRILELTSDVNRVLVRADSRTEAESRICDVITDFDPYLCAWIGDTEPGTARIVPRAVAGHEEDALEDGTATTQQASLGQKSAVVAIREQRIVVSRAVTGESKCESQRETDTERECRSVAAIPLVHRDTQYGVLVVCAKRLDTFEEGWRDALVELGSDIAHALQSLDTKENHREKYECVQQALDVLNDVLYIVGPDGELRQWNDRLSEVTGYTKEEITDMQAIEFFPENDRERITDAIDETVATGGATVEAELLTADGDRIPYELTGSRLTNSEGDLIGIVGSGRNITELKDREDELEAANTVLRTIVENLPMGVLVEDSHRNILMANDTLCDVLQFSPSAEDLIGRDCTTAATDVKDRFADPDGFIDGIERRIDERERIQNEEIKLADGRIVEQDYIPYCLPDGEANLWLYREITDRKRREQTLRRQNERLEHFSTVVSHDLQNPLNVAQGRIELARAECENDHLDEAASAVDRSLSLVDNLLTFARNGIRSEEIEAVALEETVEECWQNIATNDGTLVVETERTVRADQSRLKQLLENLLHNAIEHAGPDATVTVNDFDDGFYVADDGPGIPETERDDIFETGYTTAGDGTGFGLDIVARVAAAHDWDIRVTESETGGARFEVVTVEFTDS